MTEKERALKSNVLMNITERVKRGESIDAKEAGFLLMELGIMSRMVVLLKQQLDEANAAKVL